MLKQISFQSIPVKDQQRALEFYRDVLGMRVQTDAPYEEGFRWIFMEIPDADTLIHFAKSEEIVISSGPVLTLTSDDVDAEASRLIDLGVDMIDGPADAPWHPDVRYALFHDSENNLILLQSISVKGA